MPDTGTASPARDIEPLDLARLRDLGPNPDMVMNDSPVGVSPDGMRIAFQLRRADPATNSYCLAMVVVDLGSPARPTLIDLGGDLIRIRFTRGALAYYPAGEPRLIRPVWSPDGRQVAFLKRVSDHVQVWVAAADGSGSRQVTHAPVDVEAFDWTRGGSAIVFRTRPDRATALREVETEGLTGFVYDDRWSPVARNRPSHRKLSDAVYETVTLDGQMESASAADRHTIERQDEAPDGAFWVSATPDAIAWIAPEDRGRAYINGRLRFRDNSGKIIDCAAASCTGRFGGIWLRPGARELFFLRRTGWGNSEVSLYTWTPGRSVPRRVLTTSDHLLGCRWAGPRLICALEQSSRPRRIVSLNPADGEIKEVFDPNPAFGNLRLGSVERLEWLNDRGIEIYGDLVLPANRKPDERLPLILVQYRTRGFLRGGTGDEYPIFALAAQGFAVLSIERPAYVSDLTPTTDPAERARLNYGNWADRKSVMSAYATGIQMLAQRGLIDPKRVGITGFSDGSVSARFALLNSSMFAAAALSTCCEEPKTHMPLLGLSGAAYLRSYLYPGYNEAAPNFWKPYSIAANAARFRTPLLVQASDDEYLASLETFTSLREAGAPVDLIVFPDEHHTKWQPAHRLAMYHRSIAWFSFWLNGDAGKYARANDLARWRNLQRSREEKR